MYDPFFTIVCPACGDEQTAVNLKYSVGTPYTQTYRVKPQNYIEPVLHPMYSVVFKGKGKLVSEDRPMPKISDPKDAIVRITLSSICSSDLHILEGHVPRAKNDIIIGHEAVGIVEEVGEQVTELKKGDRVTINVETFCNECFYCEASSTFRVGQQFFKTIAGMYSSFIDDSVPFRRSSERNISQSCVESIVSKKN